MPDETIVNNAPAPATPAENGQGIGQGEGTDASATEQSKDSSEVTQAEETTVDEKGLPDDPKLLRKRLTQLSQEKAEIERSYKALSTIAQHPKFNQFLEEINKPETKTEPFPKIDPIAMTDEQKAVKSTLEPFINSSDVIQYLMKEINDLKQQTNFVTTNITSKEVAAEREKFISEHEELKDQKTSDQFAYFLQERLNSGIKTKLDEHWTEFEKQQGLLEKKIRAKLLKEMEEKKQANLLNTTGSAPTPVKGTGKLSAREAVEKAIGVVGFD